MVHCALALPLQPASCSTRVGQKSVCENTAAPSCHRMRCVPVRGLCGTACGVDPFDIMVQSGRLCQAHAVFKDLISKDLDSKDLVFPPVWLLYDPCSVLLPE